MNADIAFVSMIVGIVGVYAGFCGRVLLGVAGGILAAVGLASLIMGPGILRIHFWVALAFGVPFAMITIFLLTIARRARKNKEI